MSDTRWKENVKPIYTADFETDPFEHGKRVFPFAAGCYDGRTFAAVWSRACAKKLVEYWRKLPPGIIYFHNGGKFDLYYLFPWIEGDLLMINGRIVSCRIAGHEVRDSFSIIPIALAKYKKDDIDISKLHRDCREQNRGEILSYLQGDCVYLHELVSRFHDEFGDFMTIGSAAMTQLRKFHPFERGNKTLDSDIRKPFFFGGRVQCFKAGVISQPFKIFDVNSMYPAVMRNFRHPVSTTPSVRKTISNNTFFVTAEGRVAGEGAFPTRNRKGGVDFLPGYQRIHTTIHEFQAAERLGLFRCSKILYTYDYEESMNFDEFVSHFYAARMKAAKNEDKARVIFYKLILNSAYGKFAQNPERYSDHRITHGARLDEPWMCHTIHEGGKYVVWHKPVQRHSYYNVSVGASITGAARAVLMEGLAKAVDPIYCDTDSIICRDLPGVSHGSELGAWKLEETGDQIAIAGKKLYACFRDGECVKSATKGARIKPHEIVEVANGGTAIYRSAAPTFRIDGSVNFIKRKIRRTV